MQISQSQTILSKEELLSTDLIHVLGNENYEGYLDEEKSTQIDNFLDDHELCILKKFYFDNFKKYGNIINKVYCQISNPMTFEVVRNILEPKIRKLFGSDLIFYFSVSSDNIQVGDHYYLMTNAYTPHTDSITHIPGFVPYKDIVIPIALDKDAEVGYYTCSQRYYGRATHFKYGWKTAYFANYANIIKNQKYKDYGVKYCVDGGLSEDWYHQNIVGSGLPLSVFSGLSLENEFAWLPGTAIIHDQSVIHGPTNFKLKGVSWKLGITLHTLIKKDEYLRNESSLFSRYTLPFKEMAIESLENSKIPLKLFI